MSCVRNVLNPSQNRTGYPNPIWVSVSSNVKLVCWRDIERRKIPRKIRINDR